MPFNNPIPDHKGKHRDSGGLATLVQAEKLFQIALLLPCAALVGWLLGAWLDKLFHTEWIGIAGIVFGGISGLVYVIRLVIATGTDDTKPGGII
ncbi:MAG TPA: AtpZ/AtpI family protein [Terracidiphilus sp.]|jgi:ATP synthase protein I|nr:AtpZ/AtpI family protein [Terracidiphilus sp.]